MTTALVACTLPAIGPAWAADQGQAPNIKSAQAAAAPSQNAPSQSAPAAAQQHLDIMEYRIEGSHLLPEIEVEKAVYPYLGPNRTTEDVEKARATLEKAYNAKGYQTVAVEIPPQHVTNGIVTLKVVEGKIGRLDVKGSRFFSLDEIKKEAPSLQPGTVPNFNQVQKDIVALNQQPDRKVTPALRAGHTPGTIDADLNVEDTFPLHGSVEINNRYSQNTTPLRLNASVHYDNLWQMGHSLSLSYQIAPENPTDAKVFSGSYLARIPSVPWLSFLVYGLTSDSNVATVGDVNVAGKGHMVGARAIATLPSEQGFFHNISIGLDYKHFDEDVSLSGADQSSPITYFPMTAAYSATWQDDKSTTVFDTSVTFHLRGLGSTPDTFDAKRFDARSDFIYLKSDISRTQELPEKLQGYVKLQGQVSNAPLVNSEQFSGGGQDTVRGYLESEVLGDNGILASTELRSPSLSHWFPRGVDEWRFYGFSEGGVLSIYDPLPEQQSFFGMASIGVGTRIRLVNHLNGSLDFALPLITQTATHSGDPRLDFRVWADF